MKKEKIYEYKKLKTKDAIHHLFREKGSNNWKLHNSEGPAVEPIDPNNKDIKIEYYLFGFIKTKEEFQEFQKNKEGLPFFKQASMRVRN